MRSALLGPAHQLRRRKPQPTRDNRGLALVDPYRCANALRCGPVGRIGSHGGQPTSRSTGQPRPRRPAPHLVTAYYSVEPVPTTPLSKVAFGTQGTGGSLLTRNVQRTTYSGHHPGYRETPRLRPGDTGPLFIGRDTYGLSEPAWVSALEVLAPPIKVVAVVARDLYADAGNRARHLDLQPRPDRKRGRRDHCRRRHNPAPSTAASATTR